LATTARMIHTENKRCKHTTVSCTCQSRV